MEVLAWTTKRVLAPLALFFVGALVRYLWQGGSGWEIFDPAELSFAMSMLSLLVILSATKLRDTRLANSLVYWFAFAMIIFVSLFAWTSLLEVQIDTAVGRALGMLAESLQGAELEPALVAQALEEGHCASEMAAVERIRSFALAFSILTVAFAVVCKFRWKLED